MCGAPSGSPYPDVSTARSKSATSPLAQGSSVILEIAMQPLSRPPKLM